MQDTTFEKYEEPADTAPTRFQRVRSAVSTALGALVALSLLMALGIWFYGLGVRDAQNVPVMRASSEPSKIRPDDPGGAVAPHQDMSSYEIAESASSSAATAVIAPSPAVPQNEDVAMSALDTSVPQSEEAPTPTQTTGNGGVSVPSAPTQEAPPSEDEVASLIASLDQDASAAAAPRVAPNVTEDATDTAAQETAPEETEVASTADAEPQAPPEPEAPAGSIFAPDASPRAPARPRNLRARVETAAVEAKQDETDLASRAANSAIQIQLAADPDQEAIRARWRRIFNANKDILRDKALAVQTTSSGGTTFYRLRVGPFDSRAKALAVCEALKARGQDCIVARNS